MTHDNNDNLVSFDPNQANDGTTVVHEKLIDAEIPGYAAEFDPVEAELAGAFVEDALTEEDAIDSTIDDIEG